MATILHISNKLIKTCYSQWGLNKWCFKEITGSKAGDTENKRNRIKGSLQVYPRNQLRSSSRNLNRRRKYADFSQLNI